MTSPGTEFRYMNEMLGDFAVHRLSFERVVEACVERGLAEDVVRQVLDIAQTEAAMSGDKRDRAAAASLYATLNGNLTYRG